MNPFAWVRNRLIEKAVRRATIRLIGDNMETIMKAVLWIVNFGWFLENRRSQILAAVKGVLAALSFFHVSLPFDVQAVDGLLTKLLEWTLVLKANNFISHVRNGASAKDAARKVGGGF